MELYLIFNDSISTVQKYYNYVLVYDVLQRQRIKNDNLQQRHWIQVDNHGGTGKNRHGVLLQVSVFGLIVDTADYVNIG